MEYPKLVERLSAFLKSCPPTKIYFFYLTAYKKEAHVRRVFGSWKFNGRQLYVAPSQDESYILVYHKNTLTKLVNFVFEGARPFNTEINATNWTEIADFKSKVITTPVNTTGQQAYLGNHIDFGVGRTYDKNRKSVVLIRTHYTSYETHDGVNWERPSIRNCNFLLENAKSFVKENIATFNNLICENENKTIKEFYDDDPKHVIPTIHQLLKIITGQVTYGGGQVQIGKRGGKYIVENGKKKYLKGGAQPEVHTPSYNEITFVTEDFLDYLQRAFVNEIYDKTNDLLGAYVLFDEENELSVNGNKNIIFIYEFGITKVESVRIFYIDAKTALTACYAEKALRDKKKLTKDEQICYAIVEKFVKSFTIKVR